MSKKVLAVAVMLTIGGLISAVIAQPNPNQLINNRKGAMSLQAKYFGPVLAMSLGRAPYDAKIVQRNVEYLTVLADMPWDDFQPHTQGHQNTRAKDDVWKDPAKFKQGVERFQSDLKKLQAAARGGADQNAVRPAAQAVGRACNSCHESFATFDFRFRVE